MASSAMCAQRRCIPSLCAWKFHYIPYNTSEAALAHSEDKRGVRLKVYRFMGIHDFLTINGHGLLLDESAHLAVCMG